MQFITNGPDIPDELLQAQEEGRVVFFCGAGISYPARLPGFAELVDKLYSALAVNPNPIQQAAIKAGQFDTAISLLEANIVGGRGREMVRRELATILTPDLTAKNATKIHESLLTLGRLRDGRTRLITTNFDRVFEEVIAARSLSIESYRAPLLPVPKNRWEGLVYLHGLLDTIPIARELDRLVVSSGDFGLAYLTERWAARFVTELFRNYSICFIGYSINDPVLRYMMDALAADRLLGESSPEMFAFGSYSKGREKQRANEWRAKNVTPILYREHNRHAYLRKTLQAWAETYRDGVLGKESIVVKHALAQPQDSTQQDDFVGRMLWAVSDKSGLPAKRFANFNPAPSLDWLLEAFAKARFKHRDLLRFGILPKSEVDTKLSFSLIQRPTPYHLASPMLLVSGGITDSNWDDVMHHLARWLVRHLGDPRLIIWIAERGGQLHKRFSWLIENELDRYASLEREGKTSELSEIRLHAPHAIPSPLMRTLWRALLSDRVKSGWRDADLYRWLDCLKYEGLTATLRLELREWLAPKVVLRKRFRWGDESNSTDEPTKIRQLVNWELVLAADHVHSALRDLTEEYWASALPQLLEDFQQLLRDALDLLGEFGEADERGDRSFWDLPSVTPHWQNRGFRDWVSLIELVRESWLAVLANESFRAIRIAQSWFELPYPTFKRLALFAASKDDVIPPELWVDWLVANDAWWLWAPDTGREVFRLLVLQGQHLAGALQERLETTIIAGPSREILSGQSEPDWWANHVIYSTWLRLAKLNSSGLVLGAKAREVLAQISAENTQWQLAANERDEFSHWMSGSDDPDYEENRHVDIAPRKKQDLVKWLIKPVPEGRYFYEDTWRYACKLHPLNCLFSLADLAAQGNWIVGRWRDALYAWGNRKQVKRVLRYVVPQLKAMPDTVLKELAQSASWFIEVVSKSNHCDENILKNLCCRVLELHKEAGTGMSKDNESIDQSATVAINHPVGLVTQSLLNLWFKKNLNDKDLLPEDLEPLFTELCSVNVESFRHGRLILASQLITFFRVDYRWTEQHLLPLFDWRNPAEARAVWEGFLWSPRLYHPLLVAFKAQLLDCAVHYADLGEHRQQFVTFLTYVALGQTQGYTLEEFRSAFSVLPKEGLEVSAQAFSQALEGAGDQCEDYWRHRVQPFWKQIWPKSGELVTQRIAESLTRVAIAARGEFPAALVAVQGWLRPIEHPDYVVSLLHQSELCRRYPEGALDLLNAIISDQQWVPRNLGQCLDQITVASPQLAQDIRYLRLRMYSRRRDN